MIVRYSHTDLPARPQQSHATLRLIGLLLAICVPTAFWVFVLQLGSKAAGIAIGAPIMTAFGLAVACCCFVVTAVVMRAGVSEPAVI